MQQNAATVRGNTIDEARAGEHCLASVVIMIIVNLVLIIVMMIFLARQHDLGPHKKKSPLMVGGLR